MKNLLSLSLFILFQLAAFAQSKMVEQAVMQCDSILNLLGKEKDANNKADLVLSFYGTSIDGFPLQLLGLSQKLLDVAKQNNDIYAESAALTAAGQGYRLTGNYVKALEFHRKAVGLAEQSGNKLLLGFAINQMEIGRAHV